MSNSPKTLCEALCKGVTTLDPCSAIARDSELGKFLAKIEADLGLTPNHLAILRREP